MFEDSVSVLSGIDLGAGIAKLVQRRAMGCTYKEMGPMPGRDKRFSSSP
jgi:hypothetical protein